MPGDGDRDPAALSSSSSSTPTGRRGWGKWTTTAIVGVGVVVLLYIRFAGRASTGGCSRAPSAWRSAEGRQAGYEFTDQGFHIRTEHFEGFQKWARRRSRDR